MFFNLLHSLYIVFHHTLSFRIAEHQHFGTDCEVHRHRWDIPI